jgi:hypothetical protein
MQCKLDLIIITKTKEVINYYESFGYDGKNALNTVTNDLTNASVPAEDESNMPLKGQHFRAHSCP